MITVRFFAMLKGLVGSEEVELEVESGLTVGELKNRLIEKYPPLKEVLSSRSVLVSVNQEFGDNTTEIKDGDEVALLPPFSGG